MIEMTLATGTSALESRFDRFLYAAVREDPDGTPLTVLSVLARLDIDPWKEAAKLAQLPREAAARALAVLISALPTGFATPPDSETIAARLITLLPHRSEQGIAVRGDPSGGPHVIRIPNRATIVARAVLGLIVLALLLVSQWLTVRHLVLQPAKGPLAAPATVIAAPAARPDASRPAVSSVSLKAAGAPRIAGGRVIAGRLRSEHRCRSTPPQDAPGSSRPPIASAAVKRVTAHRRSRWNYGGIWRTSPQSLEVRRDQGRIESVRWPVTRFRFGSPSGFWTVARACPSISWH